MSAETELLDEIFGSHSYWKNKYRLYWCDHCEVWTLICPSCGVNGCSGGGCDACSGEDWKEWMKTKHCFQSYLSKEENVTVHKIFYLKKYIPLCLAAGFKEINWDWLNQVGQLCPLAYSIFPELRCFDQGKYKDMKTITTTELQEVLKNPPSTVDSVSTDSNGTTTIRYKNGTFNVFRVGALGKLSGDIREFEKSLASSNARVTGDFTSSRRLLDALTKKS